MQFETEHAVQVLPVFKKYAPLQVVHLVALEQYRHPVIALAQVLEHL